LESSHGIATRKDFFSEFFEWKISVQIRGLDRSRNRIAIWTVEVDKNGCNVDKKISPSTKTAESNEHGA
jgi:hypothetical protein